MIIRISFRAFLISIKLRKILYSPSQLVLKSQHLLEIPCGEKRIPISIGNGKRRWDWDWIMDDFVVELNKSHNITLTNNLKSAIFKLFLQLWTKSVHVLNNHITLKKFIDFVCFGITLWTANSTLFHTSWFRRSSLSRKCDGHPGNRLWMISSRCLLANVVDRLPCDLRLLIVH